MKTFCVVLFLLLATSLFAQSVLSTEPVLIQPLSHPQRAIQKTMGQEQNVLETYAYSYGKGERPLWEVVKPAKQTPLGDSARALKKEHEAAPKAKKVWTN